MNIFAILILSDSTVWKWIDGTNTNDFSYWTPGQPDSKDNANYCALIWFTNGHDGHWDDAPCDTAMKGYICQNEKSMIIVCFVITKVLFATLYLILSFFSILRWMCGRI